MLDQLCFPSITIPYYAPWDRHQYVTNWIQKMSNYLSHKRNSPEDADSRPPMHRGEPSRPFKRQRTASLEPDLLTPPKEQEEDPLCTRPTEESCNDDDDDILGHAAHVLATEAAALAYITTLYRTNPTAKQNFATAIKTIIRTQRDRGKLIVTGVGKSAYIGQKLVATCKSLGVAASFMHACEAAHGDLGDVRDVSLSCKLLYISFMRKSATNMYPERHPPLHLLQRQNARTPQPPPAHSRHNAHNRPIITHIALSLPLTRRPHARNRHLTPGAHTRERRVDFRRQRAHDIDDSRARGVGHAGAHRGGANASQRQAGGFQAKSSRRRYWHESSGVGSCEESGGESRGA